ncbi:MAG: hypothetical protein ACXWET_04940 [Halobacteriota archaeon]|jgi:hypothetical protein
MRCVDLIVSIQATVLNDWIGLIEDLSSDGVASKIQNRRDQTN